MGSGGDSDDAGGGRLLGSGVQRRCWGVEGSKRKKKIGKDVGKIKKFRAVLCLRGSIMFPRLEQEVRKIKRITIEDSCLTKGDQGEKGGEDVTGGLFILFERSVVGVRGRERRGFRGVFLGQWEGGGGGKQAEEDVGVPGKAGFKRIPVFVGTERGRGGGDMGRPWGGGKGGGNSKTKEPAKGEKVSHIDKS